MAQLTRAQARSLIQQLIDDTAAALWTAGNLDILTEAVLDELWGELLDWNAYLRATEVTPTIVSPGYFDLDTGLTRFYRLQSIVRNGQTYGEINVKDMLIDGTNFDGPSNTYAILGSKVFLFPLDTTTPINVTFADRPTAYTSLASDATAVPWPDGYHMAYIYETASRAMEKGDREKSDTFRSRAGEQIARLRAYLRKRSVGPVGPWLNDDAREWGGV
jgi:hypothetical protein